MCLTEQPHSSFPVVRVNMELYTLRVTPNENKVPATLDEVTTSHPQHHRPFIIMYGMILRLFGEALHD
jgi:hypothetical protein